MRYKILFFACIYGLLANYNVLAQDINFYNYRLTKIIDNPALMSSANKSSMSMAYRQQNINSEQFSSFLLSGIVPIKYKQDKNIRFSTGGLLLVDYSPNFITRTQFTSSNAVRVMISKESSDPYKEHYLTLGLQGGIVYTAPTRLIFENQVITGILSDEPENEPLRFRRMTQTSFGFGFSYDGALFGNRFTLGFAQNNALELFDFPTMGTSLAPRQSNLFAEYEFRTKPRESFSIIPNFRLISRSRLKIWRMGVYTIWRPFGESGFDDGVSLTRREIFNGFTLGLWHERQQGVSTESTNFIAALGIEGKPLGFSFAYNFDMSKAYQGSTFEASLQYTFGRKKCPRVKRDKDSIPDCKNDNMIANKFITQDTTNDDGGLDKYCDFELGQETIIDKYLSEMKDCLSDKYIYLFVTFPNPKDEDQWLAKTAEKLQCRGGDDPWGINCANILKYKIELDVPETSNLNNQNPCSCFVAILSASKRNQEALDSLKEKVCERFFRKGLCQFDPGGTACNKLQLKRIK